MKKQNLNIEFNSLEFATNPESVSARLRETEGLYPFRLSDGTLVYLATRRKDAELILTSGDIFKVSPALESQSYSDNPFSAAIPGANHLLATDDDLHLKLRQPLERFFTTESLEQFRSFINDEVEIILLKWKTGESHNLAAELSYTLSVKVIARMLGIPWQNELTEYALALQMIKADPAYLPQVTAFHNLLYGIVEQKRNAASNDIISALINAGFSNEETLNASLLCFIAGSGTTASLISQGLRMIIKEQRKISKKEQSELLTDEILFKFSPANSAFPRYVHKNTGVGDTKLHRGDIVLVLLSSANYDVESGRDPLKNYLSFSKGIHHCIGWYVAKMEAEVVFTLFSQHFPNAVIKNEEWFSNVVSRDLLILEVIL